MKKYSLKRNVAVLLAVLTGFNVTTNIPVFGASGVTTTITKTDVPATQNGITKEEALEKCAELGLLKGDGGKVDADYGNQNLTRMQLAHILIRLLDLEEEVANYEGTETFSDADKVKYKEGQQTLAYLKTHDLGFKGYTDGTFKPNEKVTGQMALKVLIDTLGYDEGDDYIWDTLFDFAEHIGVTSMNEEYNVNVKVYDIAQLIIEVLNEKMENKNYTLATKLGYNKNVFDLDDNIEYDVDDYNDMSRTEFKNLYNEAIDAELFKHFGYSYTNQDKDHTFSEMTTDEKVLATKSFLIYKGLYTGKLDVSTPSNFWRAYDKYIEDIGYEKILSYSGYTKGNNKELFVQVAVVISKEYDLLFVTPIHSNYDEDFGAAELDVDPVDSLVTVDLLRYAFVGSVSSYQIDEDLDDTYEVYIDTYKNVWVKTKNREVIDFGIIDEDGHYYSSKRGNFDASDLDRPKGIDKATQYDSIFNVYSIGSYNKKKQTAAIGPVKDMAYVYKMKYRA